MQKDQLKEQLTQALAGIAPKDATPTAAASGNR